MEDRKMEETDLRLSGRKLKGLPLRSNGILNLESRGC